MKKIVLFLLLFSWAKIFAQNTYNVTSSIDPVNPFNPPPNTLRWAIEQANIHPGMDIIRFNIPGIAPHIIQLHSSLPLVTSPITMDGNTQSPNGYSGNEPLIAIKGDHTNNSIQELIVLRSGASGSILKNLKVYDDYYNLLMFDNCSNTLIQNCLINTCMPCGENGIAVLQNSDHNTFKGNILGTDITYSTNNPGVELHQGIVLTRNGATSKPDNNVIGGLSPGDANFIYNMPVIQAPLDIQDGFGNKVSGNIFVNNAKNIDIYSNSACTGQMCGSGGPCNGGNGCKAPPVFQSTFTGGITDVTGTSAPHDFIELYLTNAGGIDALVLLGTTTADAAGHWSINNLSGLTATSKIIGTATSGQPANTSEFSAPVTPTDPCSNQTKNQQNYIELTSPANFATNIDPAVDVLTYRFNTVPTTPNAAPSYSVIVEVAPEIMDAITGALKPDWSTLAFVSSIPLYTPGTTVPVGTNLTQAISSLTQTNSTQNFYWRVGLQWQNQSGGFQPIDWSAIRKFSVSPLPVNIPPLSAYLTNNTQHTNNINWVYGVSYLDNGQTSEGIAYIDGLGKSRQVQSKLNSQNNIICVEAAYSEEGGGTVMTLPAPLNNPLNHFGYSVKFFDVLVSGVHSDFSTEHFDREIVASSNTIPNALMPPVGVDNASILGQYYSSSNNGTSGNTSNYYVDDAQGYPYSYNVGYKSPLQRPMLSSSGVGADFKMTAGKEYKHFYGKPTQEELDRVFGAAKELTTGNANPDAKNADKINRTITYDPNGVGHITYKDNEGKVVATAIAACNVANLDPLNEDGVNGYAAHVNDVLSGDVLDPVTLTKTATSSFFIPCNGTSVALDYEADIASFQVGTAIPCTDCNYDVTVTVVNQNTGINVFTYNGNVTPSQSACSNGGTPSHVQIINQTITLDGPANYTVVRKIGPHVNSNGQNVVTSAINTFIQSTQGGQTLSNPYYAQFLNQYNTTTDYYVLRETSITPPNPNSSSLFPCYISTTMYGDACADINFLPGIGSPVPGLESPKAVVNVAGTYFMLNDRPSTSAQLANPIVASDGSLFPGQYGNATLNLTGPTDFIYKGSSGSWPAGFFIADASGFVFIDLAATQSNVISTSLPAGVIIEYLTVNSNNDIIATATDGNVYKLTLCANYPTCTSVTSSLLTTTGAITTPSTPKSVFAHSSGNIYVSTTNSIIKLDQNNNQAIVAGSSTPGNADGLGTTALFNGIADMDEMGNGNILVTESGNKKIRIIEFPSYDVKTVTTTNGVPSGIYSGNSVGAFVYLTTDNTNNKCLLNVFSNDPLCHPSFPCLIPHNCDYLDWYADKIDFNPTTSGPFAYQLGSLDGDPDGAGTANVSGDETYLVNVNSTTTLVSPSDPIFTNFAAAYLRQNWVDPTSLIQSMNLYQVTAAASPPPFTGIPISNTNMSTLFDSDFSLDVAHPRTYYLLKVVQTKLSCVGQCTPVQSPATCNTTCNEQLQGLQEQATLAYNTLIDPSKSTTGQIYPGPFIGIHVYLWQFIAANTNNGSTILNQTLYPLLDPADQVLYDDWENAFQAAQSFNVSQCMALCNNPNPDPCQTCSPLFSQCVSDNMSDLTDGMTQLMTLWDASGNHNAFPLVYSSNSNASNSLYFVNSGVTTVNSNLQGDLGQNLFNYIASLLTNTPSSPYLVGFSTPIYVSPYDVWNNFQGGTCSSCDPTLVGIGPSYNYTDPNNPGNTLTCTITNGANLNLAQFPSALFAPLNTANQGCISDLQTCLNLSNTGGQLQQICTSTFQNCTTAVGPQPSMNDPNYTALYANWQQDIADCQTAYNNCLSGASPNSYVQLQDQMIQNTLGQLYPNPADYPTVLTLEAGLLNSPPPNGVQGLTIAQTQTFLDDYYEIQNCILTCQAQLSAQYQSWLNNLITQTVNQANNAFINGCLSNLNEKFDISYQQGFYHYTLYFYDFANNLVKTIPPEGVDFIDLNNTTMLEYSLVQSGSTITRKSRMPQHRMATTYVSNSLYTLSTTSPDEGTTRYQYDIAGRLRISQSAEQAARSAQPGGHLIFSYIIYDEDTRVKETGEYTDFSNYFGNNWNNSTLVSNVRTGYTTFPYVTAPYNAPTPYLAERTIMVYGTPVPSNITATGYTQKYLSNRVSCAIKVNKGSTANSNGVFGVNTSSTINDIVVDYYSYDAHGRVAFNVSFSNLYGPNNNSFKTTDYVYQNLTSRVEKIIYQKGKPQEEFQHRYTYDADYRLQQVDVSRDGGTNWMPTAEYAYYLHGPLRSKTLGNNIQKVDYAYNINGWLKGINNPIPGADLHNDDAAQGDAPDVFAEAVNYYRGDYHRGNVGLDQNQLSVPQPGTTLYNQQKDLFNGNISSVITNNAFSQATGGLNTKNVLGQAYTYDLLNRLTNVYAEQQVANFTAWGNGAIVPGTNDEYATHITYDANGNIQTLVRNSLNRNVPGPGLTTQMDNMTYQYALPVMNVYGTPKKINNRLAHVNDAAISESGANYSGDIKNQGPYNASNAASQNYQYDQKGRIVQDKANGILSITWTAYDKIKTMKTGTAAGAMLTPIKTMEFVYNSKQQRIAKITTDFFGTIINEETYVYDANGILMANYSNAYNGTAVTASKLTELHMYGSGRVGVYEDGTTLNLSTTGATQTNDMHKQMLEITDHLGSVRAVVTGVKTGPNATIVSLSDYHEFGMVMQGRKFVSTSYRFGYQGSEKETSAGAGGQAGWQYYTTEYRMLDSRLGRWFTNDPITHPWQSPYVSMNNNPVNFVDVLGLDGEDPCGGPPPIVTPDIGGGSTAVTLSNPPSSAGSSGVGEESVTENSSTTPISIFTSGSTSGVFSSYTSNIQTPNNFPTVADAPIYVQNDDNYGCQNNVNIDICVKDIPVWYIYEYETPLVYTNAAVALSYNPVWNILHINDDGKTPDQKRAENECKKGNSCSKNSGGLESCEEFPPASSREGGGNAFTLCVPKGENSIAGGRLGSLIYKYKLKPGDPFRVVLVQGNEPDPVNEPVPEFKTKKEYKPIVDPVPVNNPQRLNPEKVKQGAKAGTIIIAILEILAEYGWIFLL